MYELESWFFLPKLYNKESVKCVDTFIDMNTSKINSYPLDLGKIEFMEKTWWKSIKYDTKT